jgi:hypothetical protein
MAEHPGAISSRSSLGRNNIALKPMNTNLTSHAPPSRARRAAASARRRSRASSLTPLILAGALASPSVVHNAHAQALLPPGQMEHVIVFQVPGRFAAHPANRGVWIWGNEILVGFKHAVYQDKPGAHSRDESQPQIMTSARSLDGGRTWKEDDPEKFRGHLREAAPSPGGIRFTHPDFALRIERENFLYSNDRGRTWKGPYKIAGIDHALTSRTDYLVNGPGDVFLFFSAQHPEVRAGNYKDRAFMARTTDGGKTFKFVSWMTHEPVSTRSVMSSTVRVSASELVSVLRRRDDSRNNWIDAYASTDNGATWKFRSKVADTDRPDTGHNGNPPALVRLRNGRLVVAYGYRSPPFGIRARVSDDNGVTWGRELVLRDDARTWDIGYPRMVERPDGKVVTIYYITTEKDPEQHIAATIWDPNAVDFN